ncbi:MAG: type II toxin-antitoxin system VapC family toxin [Saprospiraceae bacterium]|nr:type II toxin-antitoxin system VapC family toxin [Saprospiraceae bacterium]
MVIDSSIFIEYLRSRDRQNTTLVNLPEVPALYVSDVTVFELFMGAKDESKWNDDEAILAPLVKLPFDTEAAIEASKIFQFLQKQGNIIEFRDIFIAAIAIANKLPLKTLNNKDFSRIPDLQLA